MRLVDLALPLLQAGQGLRFVILPEGMDPDDLIRQRGAGAFRKLLDGAEPMVNLLWRRETEAGNFDSPERRAALDKSLRAAIGRISDSSISAHYGEEIRRLRAELFGARRAPARGAFAPIGRPGKGRGLPPPAGALSATRSSLLAAATGPEVEEYLH